MLKTGCSKVFLLTIAFLFLGGCGLGTSNEERIERANDQVAAGEYRAAMIELKNALANDANNSAARLLLAEVSLGLGDVLAAEKELSRAIELGAPESSVLPLHFRVLVEKRDFSGGLSSLSMENEGLTDEDAWYFRGYALIGLESFEAAETTFDEWLSADADSDRAAVGLAHALIGNGDYQRAIDLMVPLVDRSPSDARAWQALGIAQRREGNLQVAEVALNNAAETIKRESDVRRYGSILAVLAETQMSLAKTDDARRNIGRLAGVFPQAPATFLLAARLERLDKDYAQAVRHLQTLLNLDPDNSQAQLMLASLQMMLGNYAQAESLLDRVVSVSPENIQARKLLAQVQLRRSRPEGAIEVLSPILDTASDDKEIYELLAQVNLQEGDAKAAIENFRAILENSPDDRDAKLNLAAAYLNADEPERALRVLTEIEDDASAGFRKEALWLASLAQSGDSDAADEYALSLLNDHRASSDAVLIVADHFAAEGDTDRASAILEEKLGISPNDISTMLSLARLSLKRGDVESAEALFQQARSVEEENLPALLGLARVAELRQLDERFVELLERTMELHPTDARSRVWLASYYLGENELVIAEKLADDAIAIGFQSARMSQIVGRVLVAAGRLNDAVIQFREAVRIAPDLPTLHFDLARTYLALERSVDAREELTKALELNPDWLSAKATLTLVELRQGNADRAFQLLDELKASYPNDAGVRVLEGELHFYQQEYEKASAAFHEAVDLGAGALATLKEFQSRVNGRLSEPDKPLLTLLAENPGDIAVRALLAEYYEKSQSTEDAVREYEIILSKFPDNVPALNNLAWHWQQAGRLDEAAKLAERAVELSPESGSVADTLGWIYKDLGRLDESLEMLARAARLSPENGEVLYHYAVVLHESGDSGRAREILEELQEDDASFPARKLADELLERI
jgi:putative PEP-CTERM system TPR-repeat lipoprotein